MANSPRKPKDPTELALSAIEDALNVHDTPREPREPAVRRTPGNDRVEAPRRGRAPQVEADDSRPLNRQNDSEVREDVAAPSRLAANDDRESVGQLLRALQRRPSRAPYVIAWLFTICWGVAFAGIALGVYGSELSDILGLSRSLPALSPLCWRRLRCSSSSPPCCRARRNCVSSASRWRRSPSASPSRKRLPATPS